MTRSFLWRLASAVLLFGLGTLWAAFIPVEAVSPNQAVHVMTQPSLPTILRTNLAAQVGLLSGLVTGGLSTAIQIFVNGVSFGGISRTFLTTGLGPKEMAIALGPHILPEFLGFFLCAAVGLGGLERLWNLVAGEGEPLSAWIADWKSGVAGIALTVVAALLEGFITAHLVNSYLHR